MGQSTNGILFYGYMWDDEIPDPDDYEDEDYDEDDEYQEDRGFVTDLDTWAANVLKAQGHADPWDSHPGGTSPEWMADNREAIDAWYDARKALTDAVPVDWDTHCSDEAPMPYLYIKGTETTAYCGSPKPIDTAALVVGADWKQKLDDFLAGQNITPPEGGNQPGWWLASYWG